MEPFSNTNQSPDHSSAASVLLNPHASAAVQDFDRLLRLLGKDCLGRRDFASLLRSVGWNEDVNDDDEDGGGCDGGAANAVYDELLALCNSAAQGQQGSNKNKPLFEALSANALRCLFSNSPTYVTCLDRRETCRIMTETVKEHFLACAQEEDEKETSKEDETTAATESSGGTTTATTPSTKACRRMSLSKRGSVRLVQNLSSIRMPSNSMQSEMADDAQAAAGRENDALDDALDFSNSQTSVLTDDEIEEAADRLLEVCSGQSDSQNSSSFLGGDGDAGGGATLEEVTASLLGYHKNTSDSSAHDKSIRELRLSDVDFDPAHVTGDAFASLLERAVRNHDALNHRLLDMISHGSFGKTRTIEVVANFLRAYKHFTSKFTTYLSECADMVGEIDEEFGDILNENLEEERGIYDEKTLAAIGGYGLDVATIDGLPHGDLFDMCQRDLAEVSDAKELRSEDVERIASPLVGAFEASCLARTAEAAQGCDSVDGTANETVESASASATAATSIAALYFGSELLVAELYTKLSSYLQSLADDNEEGCILTVQNLAFFVLHIDMDVEHAAHMRSIVVSLADTERNRRSMARTVANVLRARVEFYDRFVEAVFPAFPPTAKSGAPIYDDEAPTCPGDLVRCTDAVLEMCRPHLAVAGGGGASYALDVGCGEGRAARSLVDIGASRVIGIDASEEMVNRARRLASPREAYLAGDATSLVEELCRKPSELGVAPEMIRDGGVFDLAIAVSKVFNYTNISEMKSIMDQVFQALKPEGAFVFSVPHPFMLQAHGNSSDEDASRPDASSFVAFKGDVSSLGSFSSADHRFAGTIRDGHSLNVNVALKSISDYIDAATHCGFQISCLQEAKESAVFKVQKPCVCKIPRKVITSAHPELTFRMQIPEDAASELDSIVFELVDRGFTADSYNLSDTDMSRLQKTAAFAAAIRKRVLYDAGAAHVSGLDMKKYATVTEDASDVLIKRAKLAYYILCSLVGRVDGSARGRLFDVRNFQLDTKSDNVLFSVTNEKAQWHTDGASADKKYDCVALLCIAPAARGGSLHVSSAANALEKRIARLPKFLLHELLRPLPRDVIENGQGRGSSNVLMRLSRVEELLKLRVRHNAYPIFVESASGDRLQFRYMRHWIETGHMKAKLPLSPLLKVAMDMLDKALDEERVFSARLEPGEMVFCSNTQVAHARDAFVDGDCGPARHMVRAWIQAIEVEREIEKMKV